MESTAPGFSQGYVPGPARNWGSREKSDQSIGRGAGFKLRFSLPPGRTEGDHCPWLPPGVRIRPALQMGGPQADVTALEARELLFWRRASAAASIFILSWLLVPRRSMKTYFLSSTATVSFYRWNRFLEPAQSVPKGLDFSRFVGVPSGIRTRVTALKGPCPGPTRRWGQAPEGKAGRTV
jgi:hypothetical protein